MKFSVSISGRIRVVELTREANRWWMAVDGLAIDADAAEIAPNIFSILINGQSHEVRVTPQPGNGTLTLQTAHQEFIAQVIARRAWQERHPRPSEADRRQP